MSTTSDATGTDSTGPAAGSRPTDRPEVSIGIAFAGGFVLAKIIRRLGK